MSRLTDYYDIRLGYPPDDPEPRCTDCAHMDKDSECSLHGGVVSRHTEACEDLELEDYE